MIEPKTALDLAEELYAERQRAARGLTIDKDAACSHVLLVIATLSAIPADAAEQIARLEAELASISSEARKLAGEKGKAR